MVIPYIYYLLSLSLSPPSLALALSLSLSLSPLLGIQVTQINEPNMQNIL